MIKCIIFDCDGTLVDSEYLCNYGFELILRQYGVTASATELMHRYRGVQFGRITAEMEAEHHIVLKDDFEASYRQIVYDLFETELKPCDGVADVLAQISMPKCVASSGPEVKINKALALTGLSEYFDGNIFSCYAIGSWKPEPGIFLYAAKEMGFEPHECVVVEDSPVGIAAAKAAGMRPILYDPHALHPEISDVCTLRHMRELLDQIA